MKKLLFSVLVISAILLSCNNATQQQESIIQQRDSLLQVVNDKESQLDQILGVINTINEGFNRINEAEGRITIAQEGVERPDQRDLIIENMQFIQESMEQNRKLIYQLQQKLKLSDINSQKLNEMVDQLNNQLSQQTARIQLLEAELAEKNIIISQQQQALTEFGDSLNALASANKTQAQTIDAQDKYIHAAWYVFGTKSELKEQGILRNGEVLQTSNFNHNYFTRIDVRYDKEIKLYSKSAKILTTHPIGSYTLTKDSKQQYILQIIDISSFWSVSKYLVVLVK